MASASPQLQGSVRTFHELGFTYLVTPLITCRPMRASPSSPLHSRSSLHARAAPVRTRLQNGLFVRALARVEVRGREVRL